MLPGSAPPPLVFPNGEYVSYFTYAASTLRLSACVLLAAPTARVVAVLVAMVTLAISVAAVPTILVIMAVPVGMAILLLLVALKVLLDPILTVVGAQVAKENLAGPAALVVLLSLVAEVVVTALATQVFVAAEVVLVAMTRVFARTLVLMILAAELVLIAEVASAGTWKLMVLNREDLSKVASPKSSFPHKWR